jgi:hypothetical protein
VTLTRCFDAAYPPPSPPPGAGAVLGYIGSDYPDPERLDRDFHVWTAAEWLPFAGLRQFPVWECDITQSARASAANAVSEMRELGWSTGRALVGAMETYVAPKWWHSFENEVESLGMTAVCYGSASTVYGNDAAWYWEALYDGVPQLTDGRWPTLAKQYLSTGTIDWSVLAPQLVKLGGVGPRTQTPAPSHA